MPDGAAVTRGLFGNKRFRFTHELLVDHPHVAAMSIGASLWFWCPGCDDAHRVPIGARPDMPQGGWQWDGNYDSPTLSPSILFISAKRCHSFLRAGQLHFCGDCSHGLGGKVVDLPVLPHWVTDER